MRANLGVLFHEFDEVGKEDVVLAEEVEHLVLLLPHHQLVHELGPVAGHKHGRQLDDVAMPTTKESTHTHAHTIIGFLLIQTI